MVEKVEKTFSDVLAELRTLFALERNYLAEKRTFLAKLRTGIALALFVPPIVIFGTSFSITFPFWAVFLFFSFIIGVIAWGSWMIFNAYKEIREVRKKITLIKFREKERINSNPELKELFQDVFFIDKNNLDSEFKAYKSITKEKEEKKKEKHKTEEKEHKLKHKLNEKKLKSKIHNSKINKKYE